MLQNIELSGFMMITFKNDNDVIVYAPEKIISFATDNEYIFTPQCIWWLGAITGLQQGRIHHIDNQRICAEVNQAVFATARDISRDSLDSITAQRDWILESPEGFIQRWEELRRDYVSDPFCMTWQGTVNPLP